MSEAKREPAQDIPSELSAGLDAKIDAYLKTAEFKFYNQKWFAQYKMLDDGTITFEPNGSEFIPFEKFTDGI